MKRKNSVLIVIPVYNEAEFIGKVLFEIQRYVSSVDILVVNDGSTDDTAKKATVGRCRVINHDINLGKGEALKTAIRYAIKANYKWILTLDGDGQHPVRHIPEFIDCLHKAGNVDVIVGNRRNRSRVMPVMRILSNGITSVIVSLCAGNQRIDDSQCGYRAMKVAAIPLSRLRQSGFQFESEILIRMGKRGCNIKSLPIETVYDREKSSIHGVTDTIKFIGLILKSFSWT